MDIVDVGVTSKSGRVSRRFLIQTIVWMCVLAVGFAIDRPVAQYLHDSGFAARFKGSLLADVLRSPGFFWFTLGVAAAFWVFHPWRWKAAGLVVLAGIASGVNALIKWIAGRPRPFKVPGHFNSLLPLTFHPFPGGLAGLFHETNLGFPSGDATLAFATAAICAILVPRWRWLFYVLAGVVGLERILETAHYPSDVVAGALLGVVAAHIVYRICDWFFNTRPGTIPADAPATPR